jgi:hypothetical protein
MDETATVMENNKSIAEAVQHLPFNDAGSPFDI